MLTLLVQLLITLWISSKRLNSRSLSLSSLKFLKKIQQWEDRKSNIFPLFKEIQISFQRILNQLQKLKFSDIKKLSFFNSEATYP